MTDKSCNLSEQRVDLPWAKGSGTRCEEPVLKNIYESNTNRKELSSREAAIQGPTVLNICYCSLSNNSK